MKADLKRIYKEEKQRYTVPKSVRDYIPINTIFEDGIMKCGNLYTKTLSFSDINCPALSNEEKERRYIEYEVDSTLDSAFVQNFIDRLPDGKRRIVLIIFELFISLRLGIVLYLGLADNFFENR